MDKIKKILDPKNVTIIIYHGSCSDGFAAAFSGYFMHGDKITYYYGKYTDKREDEQLIKLIEDKKAKKEKVNILIVDFSYPIGYLTKIKNLSDALILLDHHETAYNELKDLDYCFFDMKRSGATIAWEYFWPNYPVPPVFIQCIEDRDIWTWKNQSFSSEFTTAFYELVPFEFEEYGKFITLTDNNTKWRDNTALIQQYVEKGKNIKEHVNAVVANKKNHLYIFSNGNGRKIGIINYNNYISEFGDTYTNPQLEGHMDYVLCWFYDHEAEIIRVSVRSNKKNTNCHSGNFAKKYFNGGGHQAAAGFIWKNDIKELIQKLKELVY